MKRIARTVLVLSLATTSVAAFAATPSYPANVPDEVSLSSEFPNMQTYADRHRDSAADQPPMAYPSAGLQEYPLSGEFPNLQTYRDIHKIDPVAQSKTPSFPYSVDPEPSMAEEGLVPGIAGVAPYVNANNQTAVGATR